MISFYSKEFPEKGEDQRWCGVIVQVDPETMSGEVIDANFKPNYSQLLDWFREEEIKLKGITTRIISAFPGVGKSYLFDNQDRYGLKVLDSDSSKFSWLEKGVRNPDFPRNYIEHILANLGAVDIILVSSHDTVRQSLREAGLMYEVVYPGRSEKGRYLARFRNRGNDEPFINLINDKWDDFLDQVASDPFPQHLKLPAGDVYLSDLFEPRRGE